MDFINICCLELFKILDNLGCYIKDHKDLVYTFVILIATIYIPFVISFIDRLKNKLDTKIFFSLKFNIRKILFFYGIIFLLLLFWSGKENFYFINSYILFLILIFIYFLIKELIILNDYFLINSEKINQERLDFIPKLDFKNDIEIWGASFKLDFLKDYNFSKKFTKIFFQKIKNEISNISSFKRIEKNILVENIKSLLITYNQLEYDSIFYSFFTTDKNLKLFLDIYKEIFILEEKYDIWIENELLNILKNKLEKLDSNNHGVWVFYKILEEHIEENKENIKYIKRLISYLLDLYFDSNIILENRNLVKKFPYKIKLSLSEDKSKEDYKGELSLLVFKKALDYIIDNIQQHYLDEKIVLNNKIQNILDYWFIEFEDIITFSDILYMLFVPYGDNRAKSIIKGKRTFGHISRVDIFVGNISDKKLSKDYIDKYRNTIIRFKKSLPGLINKKELGELLKQFKIIISENKLEDKYILKAKKFEKILNYLLR